MAAVLAGAPADAQARDEVSINGGGSAGVTTVNAAAGNNNQQLNSGTLARGSSGSSTASAWQHLDSSGGPSGDSTAAIAPGAFAGSSGWLAINGASGNDNQQANIAAFAFGIEAGAAADILLSQTRASQEPAGRPDGAAVEPERSVAIGAGAFENSSGLVQVSLIGGDRNTSANSFALSVSGNASP